MFSQSSLTQDPPLLYFHNLPDLFSVVMGLNGSEQHCFPVERCSRYMQDHLDEISKAHYESDVMWMAASPNPVYVINVSFTDALILKAVAFLYLVYVCYFFFLSRALPLIVDANNVSSCYM